MRDLDATDLEILRLLVEDARRPYSRIAEVVGLSAPTVSDRVDRLVEEGVIRRLTADVDRSKLQGGVDVLVEIDVAPDATTAVRDAVAAIPGIEHVFTTADGDVVAYGRVPTGDVRSLLGDHVDVSVVRDLSVRLVTDARWNPGVEATAFALSCDECGNTVDEEGRSARLGGELYHFCCGSCLGRFEDRYEAIREGV